MPMQDASRPTARAMPSHRIAIDVDADGGNQLKVKWRRDLPWGKAYSVSRGMLVEFSDRVRGRLDTLVTAAMNGRVRSGGALLKELAVAGHRLYSALFHAVGDSGRAASIRRRLEGLSGEHQITVSMGTPLHIPWGLMYEDDPKYLSGEENDVEFDHYRSFWCIKYGVASVYHLIDPEASDEPLSNERLRVHAIANGAVLARTAPLLAECGAPLWQWIVDRFGQPMYSQQDWLARWAAEYEEVVVLYFYSHADGGRIGLERDAISANDLALDLAQRQLSSRVPCLVFLNGCATAVGSPTGGFLEATAGERFCGFIGTEASIPEVYALRFGAAFLHAFLNGEGTVVEIMDSLRRKHWPLSLLYNVYCVPTLRLSQTAPAADRLLVGNFCDYSLGTRGI
jgi:hypothetical protein